MSFPNNSNMQPMFCYIHAYEPDPANCQVCFNAVYGVGSQNQGMDNPNSDYPKVDRIQAQGPYSIPRPVSGQLVANIPSGMLIQHPLLAGAKLPFPNPVNAVFQPIIVLESIVKHDHYSDRFALSPTERDHFQKEYYSDRFALSSQDEEKEADQFALPTDEKGKKKKPGRKPKVSKAQEVEKATESPTEQQEVRRSGREYKQVNYAPQDEADVEME